ncbi:MAG: hypothetical protein VB070_01970 [Clostridiaceae bacterium]|nr:hypothetical protein [Clostridiaceae bacterium]
MNIDQSGQRLRHTKQQRHPYSRLNRPGSRQGSLSLEAALIMPGVIMLIWFFISLMNGVMAEIKLKGAMDRTASELSLLSPLIQILEQANNQLQQNEAGDAASQPAVMEAAGDQRAAVSDFNDLFSTVLPGFSWEEYAGDLLLDGSSTLLTGQLVLQRIDYWLDEAEAGQAGQLSGQNSSWRACLSSVRLYLDWQLNQRQLWICMAYSLKTPFGALERQTQSVVPLWLGCDDRQVNDEQSEKDAVWLLDPLNRGQLLRQKMGGDLPYDFPVIAQFDNGEAVSIKSMDLTAPGYQSETAATAQLAGHLDVLSLFQGTQYHKNGQNLVITADQIRSRRLLLVIPENCSQMWLDTTLTEWQNTAGARGVTLEIIRYGRSYRYKEADG